MFGKLLFFPLMPNRLKRPPQKHTLSFNLVFQFVGLGDGGWWGSRRSLLKMPVQFGILIQASNAYVQQNNHLRDNQPTPLPIKAHKFPSHFLPKGRKVYHSL